MVFRLLFMDGGLWLVVMFNGVLWRVSCWVSSLSLCIHGFAWVVRNCAPRGLLGLVGPVLLHDRLLVYLAHCVAFDALDELEDGRDLVWGHFLFELRAEALEL